mmetsp:Transcript_115833/g.359878  ORF Transcript_115833/g.359878 Transcript_115833/m.359878 type:complete len:207 (+) Transcript_115833:292-912(+)
MGERMPFLLRQPAKKEKKTMTICCGVSLEGSASSCPLLMSSDMASLAVVARGGDGGVGAGAGAAGSDTDCEAPKPCCLPGPFPALAIFFHSFSFRTMSWSSSTGVPLAACLATAPGPRLATLLGCRGPTKLGPSTKNRNAAPNLPDARKGCSQLRLLRNAGVSISCRVVGWGGGRAPNAAQAGPAVRGGKAAVGMGGNQAEMAFML